MMTKNHRYVLSRLALILLVCLVGTALLTVRAADTDTQQEAATVNQTCYTIDTSRPEWLGGYTVIHLPIIMKGYAP